MNAEKKYGKTLLAGYLSLITQAICANFVPLLYLTFHRAYGISFGKLAYISTGFFFTQLVVDFLCAKFVDRIGYRRSAVAAEILSAAGLIGLSFLPEILGSPLAGIMACTVVYAVGSGLIEVLASPIIEACPFENKEGTMSLLHSFYCWGTVGVILGSTVFFSLFGVENWRVLACIWALVPLYNIYNFAVCPIESLVKDGEGMTVMQLFKTGIFWPLILLMIGAGASEIAMAQWASAFTESVLHVPKTVGDLAGPCGFAALMGLSRVLYGKYGKKASLAVLMIFSGILCVGSYLLAGLSDIPVLGLIGCMLCGFSVGILWPGSISISSSILPAGGTAMFALLALSGDLGGSVGPAVVGAVSQRAGDNLQIGILSGTGFPVLLILSVWLVKKRKNPGKLCRHRDS